MTILPPAAVETGAGLVPGTTRVPEPLFERIIAPANLAVAFQRVRANKGAPGGDGITIARFAERLEYNIAALHEDLRGGNYRTGRLRRVPIPRRDRPAGGGDDGTAHRVLAIPPVRDRVVQTAASLALQPVLDQLMSDRSYAYRPGRSAPMAVAELRRLITAGAVHLVDVDIARYFDRVPHRRLLQELAIWCQDERFLALSVQWLRSFSRWGRGLAQGAPISPLFANLYLHPVDRLLAAAGLAAVRYADDIVVACREREAAHRASAFLEGLVAGRGLTVNRRKSCVRHASQAFVFLGERVGGPDYWIAGGEGNVIQLKAETHDPNEN